MGRAEVLQYRDQIITEARKRNLDPSYGAALINWESGGDARAGLNAYAQRPDGSWVNVNGVSQGIGLMQVVPREAPNPVFVNRPGIDQLLDPTFNLATGFDILRDGVEKCGTKAGGLQQYFTGSGCTPSGLSDPNGSDFQYVNGILSLEATYFDLNNYAPPVLDGLRELAVAWAKDFHDSSQLVQAVAEHPAQLVLAALTQLSFDERVSAWKDLLTVG